MAVQRRRGATTPSCLPSAPLARRTVLRGALAGGAALAGSALLSGCAADAFAGDRTRIQFWHLFSGPDGAALQKILDDVAQENPDIEVDPVVLTWGGPYYTKLTLASVGGRAPDLAIMHATRVIGYAPGGLLEPWDEAELAKHGIDRTTMAPSLWERGFVDGKLYCVPLDLHAYVLMYNKEICAQAGVLDGAGRLVGVNSGEGFRAVARRVAAVTGDHGVSYGYANNGAEASRMFWALYGQTGARVELTPGAPAVIDKQAATRVVEYVAGLLDGEMAPVAQTSPAAIASFGTGRSGMLFGGNWEIAGAQRAGIDVDAMPFPTLMGGRPGTYGDSHAFVLPRQVNADPERRAAAYRTVAAIIKNSLTWAEGGHIPAYEPVLESTQYRTMVPQSHYASAADHAVFEPPAWFTGSGSDFQSRLGDALQSAWLDKADPAAAVDDLVRVLDATLATKPPA